MPMQVGISIETEQQLLDTFWITLLSQDTIDYKYILQLLAVTMKFNYIDNVNY